MSATVPRRTRPPGDLAQTDPEEPSLLRNCFSESFAHPDDWGRPIRAIGPWLANATEWMRLGTCRYDPEWRGWRPREAAFAYYRCSTQTRPTTAGGS